MAADNIDRVRRWHAAISKGPEDAVAAVGELFDPLGDYYPVRKFPEARPCHGQGEMAAYLASWRDAYSLTEWTVSDLIPVDDSRVLSCSNLHAEGAGSGVALEGDVYHCYWLRHGRFMRIEDHLTLKGALRALGLDGDTLEAAGLRR